MFLNININISAHYKFALNLHYTKFSLRQKKSKKIFFFCEAGKNIIKGGDLYKVKFKLSKELILLFTTNSDGITPLLFQT